MKRQNLQVELANTVMMQKLSDVYADDQEVVSLVVQRLKSLLEHFPKRYDADDIYVVRAPGRVNLIGEHTDYNGYPVMPMALSRDILVLAAAADEPVIQIGNTEPGFADREFALDSEIIPYQTGDWGNYVKAAIHGLIPHVKDGQKKVRGFYAIYDGTIPAAAGLSSSSAMVVASALTFLHANGIEMDKLQLAEILARAEQFVGTQGGGMDQAISLLGEKGAALKIDFFPLRVQPKPLNSDYRVVICNSLIRAPKTELAMLEYNRRPIECRLATALIVSAIGISPERVQRMVDLEKFPEYRLKQQELIQQVLSPSAMSLAQICEKLGMSEKALNQKYLQLKSGGIFSQPADGFKLQQRFRHVIEEARRVELAASALESGDMQRFGELMNASHASCRDLYEISTPEMERLVEIAREHGALGARLTGAGFGGCTVNLVHRSQVDSFVQGVFDNYYKKYLSQIHPEISWQKMPMESFLFATPAVKGADVILS